MIKKQKEKTGYPSIDKTHEENYSFFEKNPIIPSMSIYNTYKFMTKDFAKDNAIDCLDLTVTFKELEKNASILAKSFKELGIKPGDIVTIKTPNIYQGVVSFLAANKIGATTTFLNDFAEIDEVKRYLNKYESPLFINFNKNNDYNLNIKNNTKVKNIITVNEDELNTKTFNEKTNEKIGYSDFISFNDLKLVADYYKKPYNSFYGGNQDCIILYTSGTTGNPKSVVLTNKNLVAAAIYLKNSSKISDTHGEKSLVCVPFTYPYGIWTSTIVSLLCGREAILAPNLSKDTISYYLSKKPNIIFGSPALAELMMRNTPEDQDLSSVTTFISGGDFFPNSKVMQTKEFFEKHNAKNVEVGNGSGNAETCGNGTNPVGVPYKPGTAGKVLTGISAIVIDPETNQELKYNEEGMLCISSKHVFKEYFKEEELTKKVKFMFKGKEYFKTGTIGKLDEEGYFTITGRDSRFYIISTLNKIYCDYVQNVMTAIDVIDSCAVVEVPDEENLYTSTAFIVLKDGVLPTKETEEYIQNKCLQKLIMPISKEEVQLKLYEIPTNFQFIKQLPRTVADKIDYNALKDIALEEKSKEMQRVRKNN